MRLLSRVEHQWDAWVKSTKERFKSILTDVEQAASELRILSSQLAWLEDVQQVADSVLRICTFLRGSVAELPKIGFAGQMALEGYLAELDEIADTDLMNALEERLAVACAEGANDERLGVFFGQLLDKLEQSHAAMIEHIQRLTALLARVD